MLTLRAPAKINLTLEVLGTRSDGYHEIRSVLQAISLCDILTFEPSDKIEIKSESSGWEAEKSLVFKVATLLQQSSGCTKGAEITVEKHIPLTSGLGGDSSDAAAALKGINQLWQLDMPTESMAGLAAKLGSDVPFFLDGPTALAKGRGEILTPLPPVAKLWVVLATPEVTGMPGKTRQLYESLKKNHYTDGRITQELADRLKSGKNLDISTLFNTFENVAYDLWPLVGTTRSHMLKMGARNVHLAGSGPTLFTLIKDQTEAEDLYNRLKKQNLSPMLAQTL
jgi:4-diphosphocytidyl-2-C-methyl-D-erythritol kinase